MSFRLFCPLPSWSASAGRTLDTESAQMLLIISGHCSIIQLLTNKESGWIVIYTNHRARKWVLLLQIISEWCSTIQHWGKIAWPWNMKYYVTLVIWTLASVLSYLMSESCPRTGACPKFLQSRLSQSSARRVWGRANYIIIARYDATLFLHSSLLLVSPSPRLRSLPRPWSPHPTSCPCSRSIDLSTGKH